MPSLGADMEFGKLLEWHVKPGDLVKRGDIVAIVDTSKAEIEVEIFEDGVIDELVVSEGTRVPVGALLATLRPAAGEAPGTLEPTVAAPESPAAPRALPAPEPAASVSEAAVAPLPRTPPPAPLAAPAHQDRPRVSPVARRVAESLGVDLGAVTGSGPAGAITKADVELAAGAAVAASAAVPSEGKAPVEPAAPAASVAAADRQAAMRQAIGALMARSKREIPHYYLETQIDMSSALAWLREENDRRAVTARLLPSVLLLSAVARAAAETPAFNGFWVEDAFRPAGAVHLGVAISLRGGGLIAPALLDADRKTLDDLMLGLRDLVGRARSGRLRSSEMSDPTITVTNLGEQGVDLVHGVIYPPQVALVGFGAIRERPWASEGMIGARPVTHATLAADHRASDGHAGGRFLALIDRLLQKPEEL